MAHPCAVTHEFRYYAQRLYQISYYCNIQPYRFGRARRVTRLLEVTGLYKYLKTVRSNKKTIS
jgi:hypothetical protein